MGNEGQKVSGLSLACLLSAACYVGHPKKWQALDQMFRGPFWEGGFYILQTWETPGEARSWSKRPFLGRRLFTSCKTWETFFPFWEGGCLHLANVRKVLVDQIRASLGDPLLCFTAINILLLHVMFHYYSSLHTTLAWSHSSTRRRYTRAQ